MAVLKIVKEIYEILNFTNNISYMLQDDLCRVYRRIYKFA